MSKDNCDMTLKQFVEEWKDSIKYRDKTYEIFVNPSQKEIDDFAKKRQLLVRVIIDSESKKVYLFGINLLHTYAAKHLNIPYKNSEIRTFVVGELQKGKKIRIQEHDYLFLNKLLKNKKEEEIKWLWKYIEKPNNLKEEWKDSFQHEKKTIEVFTNPTKKEMDSVSKEYSGKKYIRFIAHENKLYVFTPNVLHYIVDRELKLDSEKIGFWGTAFKRDGSWKFEGSDSHRRNVIPKFVSKWIDIPEGRSHNVSTLPMQFAEEWKTSIKVQEPFSIKKSKIFDVYRNPTPSEMDKASRYKRLRFIATANPKELLVWDPDVLHHVVARKFDINLYGGDKIVVAGEIKKESEGWRFAGSFNYESVTEEKRKKIRKTNWKWTRKSFDGLQEFLRKKEG